MGETFQVGDRFGGFHVLAKIGIGEFGETWLCENDVTKRKAVLKGLKEDIFLSAAKFIKEFDMVTRSKEEAEIASALGDKHLPFVPIVYDVVQIPDGRFFSSLSLSKVQC